MKFGITMMAGPRRWVEYTQTAEAAGFESVWLPEHLVMPAKMTGTPNHPDAGGENSYISAAMPAFDVWMQVAYLAGLTSTIRFGTNVYNIGLRHPFVVGRAVATADLVSQGRVEFGIGASWLKEEWDAVGLPFESRGGRVDESIRVIQRLFTEDEIAHEGEFYRFDAVGFLPKPIQQPWPAMLIGGDSPRAIRRAAELGDGWLPMEQTLETLPGNLKKLAELREKYGRDGTTEVTLGAPADVDTLRRYEELGVHRVLVRPFDSPKESADGMKRFGDEVLPLFASS